MSRSNSAPFARRSSSSRTRRSTYSQGAMGLGCSALLALVRGADVMAMQSPAP